MQLIVFMFIWLWRKLWRDYTWQDIRTKWYLRFFQINSVHFYDIQYPDEEKISIVL